MVDRENINMEERKSLLGGISNRVTTFFRRREISPELLRGFIVGGTASLVMAEVFLYLLLQGDSTAGRVSGFTPNAIFISVSVFESVASLFLGWIGRRRRVLTIAVWLLITTLCSLPLFFLIDGFVDTSGQVLCNAPVPRTLSSTTSLARVVFVVAAIVACACTRNVLLVHGVSLTRDTSDKDTGKLLGAIIALRTMMIITAKFTMAENMASTNKLTLQLVLSFLPLGVKSIVLFIFFVEVGDVRDKIAVGERLETSGYLSSLRRVFTNPLALQHIISAAVLAAAVWGFLFHRADVWKTKYHISMDATTRHFAWAHSILFVVVILCLNLVITQFSSPVMELFNATKAAKRALFFTIISVAVLCGIIFIGCDEPHQIRGLYETGYVMPECSRGCGCASPKHTFSPVCITETMTTYYSACHAGCTNTKDVNGFNVSSSCLCAAPHAHAVGGACGGGGGGGGGCQHVLWLHIVMEVVFVTLTLSSIFLNTLGLLHTVRRGDTAAALGAAAAAATLLACVAAHSTYLGISAISCIWSEGGTCQLHRASFPNTIGYVSLGLICFVAVTNFVVLRLSKKRRLTE